MGSIELAIYENEYVCYQNKFKNPNTGYFKCSCIRSHHADVLFKIKESAGFI